MRDQYVEATNPDEARHKVREYLDKKFPKQFLAMGGVTEVGVVIR